MKTCVITGASSGIGRAAAIRICELDEYSRIILIGRREGNLIETKSLLNRSTQVDVVPFDLQDLSNIPGMVNEIYNHNSSIDCLVNVAGYTDPKFLFETTNDNIEMTFRINVFAPYVLSRECARYMKSQPGISKIINIASTAGSSPRPGWSIYAMSKASIIEMSLTLSEELASYGIKVYCLSPGRCATELRRRLAPDEDQSKIMQPDDVGQEIARMASNSENCLDGQNIVIRRRF